MIFYDGLSKCAVMVLIQIADHISCYEGFYLESQFLEH